MTEANSRKVLNALFGYKTFKRYLANSTQASAGLAYSYSGNGQIELISAADLNKAIEVAERTQAYFALQDESKGKFVQLYFFERIGWLQIMDKIGVSYGTISYWRKDVIAIAKKIAVKNGFVS